MPKNWIENIGKAPSLGKVFQDVSTEFAHSTLYRFPILTRSDLLPESSPRTWLSASYDETQIRVWKLSSYLRSLGVKKGDAVAILSYTRPEWMIADLAIVSLGAISVSIYHSLSQNDVGYILFDSQAKFVFIENQEQCNKVLSLTTSPCVMPATEERESTTTTLTIKRIISFEEVSDHPLVTSLQKILEDSSYPSESPPELSTISRDDVAAFVYTSGTTGPPKGVVQTHGNHLSNITQAAHTELFAPGGNIFLFLPLAHSFAKLIGYIGFLTPTTIIFPAVTDRLSSQFRAQSILRDLSESKAQVVPSVPRVLEKMMGGVELKSLSTSLSGKLLKLTLDTAKSRFKFKASNTPVPVKLKILWLLTSAIRKKIKRQLFGETFQHAISGGAKLPLVVAEFFASLEIAIYEGYGLTETCVATNVCLKGKNKIGSVGPAMKDVQLKIAEDGEILFKGPNITKGYHNRPTATAQAWDALGWFHTGDLGHVDSEGMLYITGRKKELIVTAGGKKVAPQAIEDKLQSSVFISHALLFGEGKPYCIAAVTLDRERVQEWLHSEGVSLSSELWNSQEVKKLIESDIEKVNETLSKHETIKKFVILPVEFSVENSYLTPTFKVKKSLIEKEFKKQLEDLYVMP